MPDDPLSNNLTHERVKNLVTQHYIIMITTLSAQSQLP